MDIDGFLERLYSVGCRNDEAALDRESMMLNITPSTGAFLDILVGDARPTRILEIGTSNGYSTCWLARAARRVNASVDTVDRSSKKIEAASRNLAACDLADRVTLYESDAGEFLSGSPSDEYDLVFLDSNRSVYLEWMTDLLRVTNFGLIVVDNALSHVDELSDFRRALVDEYGLSVVTLPIGKGQLIIQPGD